MKYFNSKELIDYLKEKPSAAFWARSSDSEEWVLLESVSIRGIEYGMRTWQFYGPILPPN